MSVVSMAHLELPHKSLASQGERSQPALPQFPWLNKQVYQWLGYLNVADNMVVPQLSLEKKVPFLLSSVSLK